ASETSGGAASSEGSSAAPPAAAPVAPAAASAPAAEAVATVPDRGPRSQILSPLVRKLAKEHDLDLSQISGTGSGGRITKADVMGVVAAGGTAPRAPAATTAATAPALAQPMPAPAAGAGEEVVPITHIRRAI